MINRLEINKFLLIVFIFLFSIFTFIFQKRLSYPPIISDGDGYYSYLPAVFINNDLFSLNPSYYEKHREFLTYPAYNLWQETGKYLNKYPMGTAILMSPMFYIATIISKLTGLSVTGYNDTYQYLACISTIIYLVLGFYFLYIFLKKYFSKNLIYFGFLLTLLSTNLLNYSVYDSIFSHIYSFFAISLSIYLTDIWHKNPKSPKTSIFLGLSFGLNFLIRNTNSTIILFWIFYNIYSLNSLKEKFILLKNNYINVLLIVIFFILSISPQLFYFYKITNHIWVFSYTKESFNFLNPAWYGVLFSPRRGLFFWAPIFLLSVFSLNKEISKYKKFILSSIIFLSFQLYLIASWHQWWYGDCFGNRAFIDSYPIITIFLIASLKYIYSTKTKIKYLITTFIILCLYLNLKLTYKYWFWELPRDNITLKTYFNIIKSK